MRNSGHMKLHPFKECMRRADELIARGADIYQQFNCAECGAKQTIDLPNVFFAHGICARCGHQTNIEQDGCNYAVHIAIARQRT